MKDNNSWRLSVAVAACIFIMLVCVFSAWKAALRHNDDTHVAEGIQVLATVYPVYVPLLSITQGTQARTSLLAPAGTGCVHDWQLTTGDMKHLQTADLVVACGEGMEGYLDKMRTMKGDALVTICSGWEHLEAGNPHIWLSPSGAAWQARRIAEALAAIDPTNAALYMANCDEYTARIAALGVRLNEAMAPYRGRKVVLLHEAFAYLVREAGFDVVFTISEEELSSPVARHIGEVSSLIREARGSGSEIVCFADATESATVRSIEQEAAVRVWRLDTCTTGELAPLSYIDAMDANIALMVAAFGGGE